MIIRLWHVIWDSYRTWRKNNAPLLSAAFSYYTLFSLAPILLLVILLAGSFIGEQNIKSEITLQIKDIFGPKSAETVSGMIERTRAPHQGAIATPLSIIILFFASTNLFQNLRKILNIIWGCPPRTRNWFYSQLIDRLLSFSIVLIFGVLFIISFMIDTGLVGFGEYIKPLLPQSAYSHLWEFMNFGFSVIFMFTFFTIIYKVLPSVKIAWKDVWFGALLTAILIASTKLLIGLYLGNSRIGTIFGGASSLIVILIWTYYSAQFFLFGAEITRHFAYTFGSYRKQTFEGNLQETSSDGIN